MRRSLIGIFMAAGLSWPAYAEQPDNELPPGAIARLGKVRYPNVGRVLAVSYAPDGKTLLAGAWDGFIWWWDVPRRTEIRHSQAHTGPVRALVSSHNGKLIASGSDDRTVGLWDSATGEERSRIRTGAEVRSLAFSQDDKLLAYLERGTAVHIWDVANKTELRSLPLSQRVNAGFGFAQDASLFAGTFERYSVAIVDVAAGKERRRLVHSFALFPKSSYSWFPEFVFSPDTKTIVGCGWDHILHTWDQASGKERRPLGDWQDDSYHAVFSPDGRSIASAGDEHIHVWELLTRGERCRFACPDKQPSALAFSPDGRCLAQGSEDQSVLLWDIAGLQGPGGLPAPALTPGKLQALWGELASADAEVAFRAIWMLAFAPTSVPFLREQIHPVPSVEVGIVRRLVTDLASDRLQTRKDATERLERLAELAESALRQALKDSALEHRQRIEALLEKIETNRETPSAKRVRDSRALEALERMAVPAARALLEELARGAPEADVTQQAKAALERLKNG